MRRRTIVWGLAAAVVYVSVALASFDAGLFPARPLYDGLIPPEPYRFVDPPPALEVENIPPEPVTEEMPLQQILQGATFATPDQQIFVIFGPDAIAERDTEESVELTIEPLAPDTFGPPPEGFGYDGNAYRVEAVYQPSGDPVELTDTVTILMRFPFAGEMLMIREGDEWVDLQGSRGGGFEMFVSSERLGEFVLVGFPFHVGGDGPGVPDWVFAVAGLAVVVAGVVAGRRRAGQKREEARAKAMGKKAKRKPKGAS